MIFSIQRRNEFFGRSRFTRGRFFGFRGRRFAGVYYIKEGWGIRSWNFEGNDVTYLGMQIAKVPNNANGFTGTELHSDNYEGEIYDI